MNWQAVPQRLCSGVREMPQSVHRSRGTAGAIGGAHSKAELAGLLGNSGKVTPLIINGPRRPQPPLVHRRWRQSPLGASRSSVDGLEPLGSLG